MYAHYTKFYIARLVMKDIMEHAVVYLKQTLPNIVNLDSVADELADFKEGRNEGMSFRFRDDIHSASSLQ